MEFHLGLCIDLLILFHLPFSLSQRKLQVLKPSTYTNKQNKKCHLLTLLLLVWSLLLRSLLLLLALFPTLLAALFPQLPTQLLLLHHLYLLRLLPVLHLVPLNPMQQQVSVLLTQFPGNMVLSWAL